MRLSVEEAASTLGVSTKTIYRWVADGRIPGYRVNKQYRFDRAELLEWATAQRLGLPTTPPEADEHREAHVPRFDEALEAGGLYYRLGGADRNEALRDAVNVSRIVDEADRDVLVQALVAREELAPTAVGDGFALPHLRNPLRYEIRKATVSLCYLERALDWGAPDGRPVSVLLVVVGPTVRSILRLHIEALFAVRDAGFRGAVQGHAPRESVLAEARRLASVFRRPGAPA